jgi:hypothetical protein
MMRSRVDCASRPAPAILIEACRGSIMFVHFSADIIIW